MGAGDCRISMLDLSLLSFFLIRALKQKQMGHRQLIVVSAGARVEPGTASLEAQLKNSGDAGWVCSLYCW